MRQGSIPSDRIKHAGFAYAALEDVLGGLQQRGGFLNLILNIHYTDGSIYTKATSKSILVERNTILPFATIAADGESDWQSIEIHHTGSEIVAPIVSGVGSIDWGDGTTSMIDELRKRYYTDGKESHVITIKSMGATDFQLKSCEGVSKIDLSEF